MIKAIISAGILVIAAMMFLYLVYCIGLSLVFKKLSTPRWRAFIPMINYFSLINALGLPKSWYGASIVPYAGTVYSIAIAIRLGKVFGKGTAFSSFWLTAAAPVGMFVISLSKVKLDLAVIKSPAPAIDPRKAMRSASKKLHISKKE